MSCQEDANTAHQASNTETIWNALVSEIGNEFGAAGVMGNLEAESSLTPNNLQSNGNRNLGMDDKMYTQAVDDGTYSAESFAHDNFGYGLAQWTYWTRKQALLNYAKSKGASVGDLQMQLEFLIKELRTYKAVWEKLTQATSVREASDAMMLGFEKPANQSEANQESRANRGQRFYDLFAQKKEGEKVNMGQKADYNAKVTAQNGNAVNMRQSPSASAKIIATIRTGTTVRVTEECDDEWACIEANGTTGYMMRKFLTDENGEAITITLPKELAMK